MNQTKQTTQMNQNTQMNQTTQMNQMSQTNQMNQTTQTARPYQLKLKDFQYELPERLIAQRPAEQRTGSRLMVIDREKNSIEHRTFPELTEYLSFGDCMVLNNTRVISARLLGRRADTGANVEFLLLERMAPPNTWEVMVSPGRKVKPGVMIVFGDGMLEASVKEILESGNRVVEFRFDGNDFERILDSLGRIPLPPYIKDHNVNPERYQTVYSRYNGSVAAPTAGLHFTDEFLESVRDMGVATAFVTLHVGAGTFLPVKSEDITDHKMHSENYFVDNTASDAINRAKVKRGRIIAVGTTSMRTLETISDEKGFVEPCEGRTNIFIYPGYRFKCVDALLTNFHLPGSTLIMLVSAFAGYDLTMKAYSEAVQHEYRFFSFGDAMLIV